jgi:hypothetical protein
MTDKEPRAFGTFTDMQGQQINVDEVPPLLVGDEQAIWILTKSPDNDKYVRLTNPMPCLNIEQAKELKEALTKFIKTATTENAA